jgi:hypothetical protein
MKNHITNILSPNVNSPISKKYSPMLNTPVPVTYAFSLAPSLLRLITYAFSLVPYFLHLVSSAFLKKRNYFILLLLLLPFTNINSQTKYPIRTQTIVTPPYPGSLEDFYADGGNRITLQVFANNTELSNYPVKFRLVLLGPGVEITTDPAFTPPQFTINGGETYSLTGSDLASYFNPTNLIFKGYSKAQYQRTGRLPDGVYRLSFEVLFYFNSEISVASTTPALIWLFQNEPPLLNFPANKEIISAVAAQNIMFNWTKRQSPFSSPNFAPEYKFDLWEIWPDEKDANEISRTTKPIYSSTLTNTSLVYSSNEPLLFTGRRYAWRVQVFDPDGNATFKNNGLTEVRWFRFGKVCPVPVISLEKAGVATIAVKWDGDYRQTRYEVRYREKKRKDAQWYTKSTTQYDVTIDNLKPLTQYEVQVLGFCDDQPGDYSNILTATTKAETNFSCGVAAGKPDLSNTRLLDKLVPKDYIKAGDFDIQITEASGSNGTFTGKGLVLVPYLKYLKYEVVFKNIKVNDEYRLTDGSIYTVYNLNNALIGHMETPQFLQPDMNKPVEENAFAGNEKIIKATTDTTLTEIKFSNGVVEYTKANGEIVKVRASQGEVVAISNPDDKGAPQYVADTKTNTVYTGKPETKGSTANATSATPRAKSQGTAYSVTFAAHNQQDYGFDSPTTGGPAANYQTITIDGKQQLIPWKSIEAGRADRIKARVIGGPIDSVHYRRESQQLVMTAPGTTDTVQLMLSGQTDMEEDNLYAWYPEYHKVNDSVTSQDRVLAGQVNLVSYDKKKLTVYLVPVNGSAYPANSTEVQQYLNKVYAQALVEWNVQKINDFRVSINGSETKKIDNTDKDNSMNYTADMKAVINAFQQYSQINNDAYYLFFFDDATNQNLKGYMPFNKQFGFIFKYKQGVTYQRTIAHELGHGAFRLYHTFSDKNKYVQPEGSTNNLMDYVADGKTLTAINLQKYQWDEVHSWHVGANWLEEGEEGEQVTVNNIELLKKFWNKNTHSYTFLSTAGKPISIKETLQKVSFVTPDDSWNTTGNTPPLGTLTQFTIKTTDGKLKSYKVVKTEGTSDILGYYCEDDKQLYKDEISSKVERLENVLTGILCWKNHDVIFKVFSTSYFEKYPSQAKVQIINKGEGTEKDMYFLSDYMDRIGEAVEVYGQLDVKFTEDDFSFIDAQTRNQDICGYDALHLFNIAYIVHNRPGLKLCMSNALKDVDCSVSNLLRAEDEQKLSTQIIASSTAVGPNGKQAQEEVKRYSEIYKDKYQDKYLSYLNQTLSKYNKILKDKKFFDSDKKSLDDIIEFFNISNANGRICLLRNIPIDLRIDLIKRHGEWKLTDGKEKLIVDLIETLPDKDIHKFLNFLKGDDEKYTWFLSLYRDLHLSDYDRFVTAVTVQIMKDNPADNSWVKATQMTYLNADVAPAVDDFSLPLYIGKDAYLPDGWMAIPLATLDNDMVTVGRRLDGPKDRWGNTNYKRYYTQKLFGYVAVEFVDDYQLPNIQSGEKIKKNQRAIVPAFWVYWLINKQNQIENFANIRIVLDFGAAILSAITMEPGPMLAVEFLMSGIDIVVAINEDKINSSDNEVLKSYVSAWNGLAATYGAALITTSTLKSITNFKFSIEELSKTVDKIRGSPEKLAQFTSDLYKIAIKTASDLKKFKGSELLRSLVLKAYLEAKILTYSKNLSTDTKIFVSQGNNIVYRTMVNGVATEFATGKTIFKEGTESLTVQITRWYKESDGEVTSVLNEFHDVNYVDAAGKETKGSLETVLTKDGQVLVRETKEVVDIDKIVNTLKSSVLSKILNNTDYQLQLTNAELKKLVELGRKFNLADDDIEAFVLAHCRRYWQANIEDMLKVMESIATKNLNNVIGFKPGWNMLKAYKEAQNRMARGSYLAPEEYLTSDYIKSHLAKFQNSACYFVNKQSYERFVKGKLAVGIPDDNSLYILTTKEADDIVNSAANDLSKYEGLLGYSSGYFSSGNEIWRINIKNPEKFNLRLPSGNEIGANHWWHPGGYTSGGTIEAVTNTIEKEINGIKIIEEKRIVP